MCTLIATLESKITPKRKTSKPCKDTAIVKTYCMTTLRSIGANNAGNQHSPNKGTRNRPLRRSRYRLEITGKEKIRLNTI